VEDDEDDGVQLFVHLPLPLYARLRLVAVRDGVTLAQATRATLDRHLPSAEAS
jgi:hypothetical protein